MFTTHGLGVPPPVAAVFRAFATLEGTLGLIRPGFDLVGHARAVASGRIAEALAPDRLRGTLEDELAALLPVLRRLPRRVDRIGDALEHGRLRVNVRLFADDQDRRLVTGLVHQALTDGDRRGGRRDGGAAARRRRRAPRSPTPSTCSRCSVTAC